MSNWGLLQTSFQSDWQRFISSKSYLFNMNPGRLGVVTTNIAFFSKAALNSFNREDRSISLVYVNGKTTDEIKMSFLKALRDSENKVLFLDFFNTVENEIDARTLAKTINTQREFCISKFSAVYIFAKPNLVQALQLYAPDFWSCVEDRFDMTSWYFDLCVAPILEIKSSGASLSSIYRQENDIKHEYLELRSDIDDIKCFNFTQIESMANDITNSDIPSELKADLFYRFLITLDTLDISQPGNSQKLLGWCRALLRKFSGDVHYWYCITKLAEILFYKNDYTSARMAYSTVIKLCKDGDSLLCACLECNYQVVQHIIDPKQPLSRIDVLCRQLEPLGLDFLTEYMRSLYGTSRLSKMLGSQKIILDAHCQGYSVSIFTTEILSLDIDSLQLGTEALAKHLKLSGILPIMHKLILDFYGVVEKFKKCTSKAEYVALLNKLNWIRVNTRRDGYKALYMSLEVMTQNIRYIGNAVFGSPLDFDRALQNNVGYAQM